MGATFITGSTGLIGSGLSRSLGLEARTGRERLDLRADSGWSGAFAGCETVIHCAALNTSRGHSVEDLESVNVTGTKRIAKIARDVGVSRFVFLSSVKVFGEYTEGSDRFTDNVGERKPGSVYGRSKAVAEDELMGLHTAGEFEVVVIRPTVVVSRDSAGAVGSMAKYAGKGIPFPVPIEENARDFVNIDNLVSAIVAASSHPETGGRAFSITDGGEVSTRALYDSMAVAGRQRGRFIPVPGKLSLIMARAARREGLWHRVFGNLRVDGSHFTNTTGWTPGLGTLDFVARHFGAMEDESR